MADTKGEPEATSHADESAPERAAPASGSPTSQPASISPPAPSTEPYSIEIQLSDAPTGYRQAVEQIVKDLYLFLRDRVGLRAEQKVFDVHLAAQWCETYVSHGIQFLGETYSLMERSEYAGAEEWARSLGGERTMAGI
jgi:hypothetical protein